MPAFEQVTSPTPDDALLGEFGGVFGLARIADLLGVGGFASEAEVTALRSALQAIVADGSLVLPGLSAGSVVALIAFGVGGTTAPLVVKAGSVTLQTTTLPGFVKSINVSTSPDSGAVVSVDPVFAVPPFARALVYIAPADGDVTFAATGPGTVSLLAIRLK